MPPCVRVRCCVNLTPPFFVFRGMATAGHPLRKVHRSRTGIGNVFPERESEDEQSPAVEARGERSASSRKTVVVDSSSSSGSSSSSEHNDNARVRTDTVTWVVWRCSIVILCGRPQPAPRDTPAASTEPLVEAVAKYFCLKRGDQRNKFLRRIRRSLVHEYPYECPMEGEC